MINFLEQWLQSDVKYVLKGGIWLTIGKAFASLGSFFLTVAFAHFADKEVFGMYKYVISVSGILVIFTLSGMVPAVTRSVARGAEIVFYKALLVRLKWGLLGAICGLIVASYYWFQGNEQLFLIFSVVSFLIPFFGSFSLFISLLKGRQQFQTLGLLQGGIDFLVYTSIVGVLFWKVNLFFILLMYFGLYTLLRMLATLFILLKKPLQKINSEASATQVISYGKHLTVLRIITTITYNIDNILLWHFLGPVQVAIYAIAVAPVRQVKSFVELLQSLALPRFAIRSSKKIHATLPKKIAKVTFIILCIVVFYIILTPYFFPLLFPGYSESIALSQIFALTLLVLPAKLFHASLTAHAKKKALYSIQIPSQMLRIILLIIFLYLYGVWGLILAYLISEVIEGLISYVVFKRMMI